jgi:hypothetical protein
MIEFRLRTRREAATRNTRPHAPRHRAGPAKPASALSRFASGLGSTGGRAAVTTAGAVLIGVGAAGDAAETARRNASAPSTSPSTTSAPSTSPSTTSADPLAHLNLERVLVTTQPADAGNVAPESDEEMPLEAPAPAPAPAPGPASAPGPGPAPVPAPASAPAPAPPLTVDDPSGAQAYAAAQLGSYGWSASEMKCLTTLWTKESDWLTSAMNPSSGAYGVVQSLPPEKMASAGDDYLTNYRTQINWGLNYVQKRYGSPCSALDFHYANNWY